MRIAVLLAVVALGSTAAAAAPDAREGSIVADDGVRLFYREIGGGRDAIVIPVAVWTSPHFDRLARGDRRVVYYDPRGRGRSETGDLKAVSLDRATRDLQQLLDRLSITQATLVGWSGYGMEMAAFALAHPDRVARLVQLNPVPPRQEPYMSQRMAGMRERVDVSELRRYQEMVRDGRPQPDLCRQYNRATAPSFAAHPERVKASIERLCELPAEWPANQQKFFVAFMSSIAGLDFRPRISELRMPRLVIHGDRDLIAVEGVQEWLVPGNDQARLLIVEGADHASFIDEPDAVVGAIDTFVQGEWPPRATRP